MQDLISVIVPVYNAEKYIVKCVMSIQQQSYSDLELILVNDGSEDASLVICRELEKEDPRIIVLDRINGGASAARNAGLDIAKGEYIVFADSDDFVSPDYIKNLYLAAKQGNYDIVQCNLRIIKNHEFQAGKVAFNSLDLCEVSKSQALNKRMYKVSIWGKIYKREIFTSFHFQEGIIYEDDASYYLFIDRAKKIGILNETLYFYFMSDNSVMRNDKKDKSTAFIGIYQDRIRYFQERNDQELLDGTYDRFCLVLMLTYSSSLRHGNNKGDREKFLHLFKQYYPLVMKSTHIRKKEKWMFRCFHCCPQIAGKIIGRMRG